MAVDSKRASGFLALSRFGYGARGSSDDLSLIHISEPTRPY